MSLEQRKLWAEYFERENIEFVFFSAIEEQERIEDFREKQNQEKEENEEDDEEKEENTQNDRLRLHFNFGK